eukprot:UN07655
MFISPFNIRTKNTAKQIEDNGNDNNKNNNNNNIMAMIYTAIVLCIALCSGVYLQQIGLAWLRSGDSYTTMSGITTTTTTTTTTTNIVMGILQEQQQQTQSNLPLCTGGEISDVQFAISVVLAFVTFVIYAPSRIPQIIKIHRRKSN